VQRQIERKDNFSTNGALPTRQFMPKKKEPQNGTTRRGEGTERIIGRVNMIKVHDTNVQK
jgi:hypothetical protein